MPQIMSRICGKIVSKTAKSQDLLLLFPKLKFIVNRSEFIIINFRSIIDTRLIVIDVYVHVGDVYLKQFFVCQC